MNFFLETRKMIKKSNLTVDELATGAGVHRAWLWRVVTGRIQSPGVTKLQKVYDYLKKREQK